MAHAVPIPPPGFDRPSADEKIRYVQDLWDYIAANTTKVPVPDWHRRVLDERLAEYHADPHEAESWHRLITIPVALIRRELGELSPSMHAQVASRLNKL